jgi:hypothetical protein
MSCVLTELPAERASGGPSSDRISRYDRFLGSAQAHRVETEGCIRTRYHLAARSMFLAISLLLATCSACGLGAGVSTPTLPPA